MSLDVWASYFLGSQHEEEETRGGEGERERKKKTGRETHCTELFFTRKTIKGRIRKRPTIDDRKRTRIREDTKTSKGVNEKRQSQSFERERENKKGG